MQQEFPQSKQNMLLTKDCQEQLFNAIVADDVAVFDSLVDFDNNICVSFGRFPILSACLLLNSTKIMAIHSATLIAQTEYSVVAEPALLSKKLRAVSAKALRLYQAHNAIITPLEMSALLNDAVIFNKFYNVADKSDAVMQRINKIYVIENRVDVDVSAPVIKLPKQRMRGKERIIAIILVIAIVVLMGGTGAVTYFSYYLSRGTEENPIHANSDEQFLDCINGNYNFISIANDITLENVASLSTYSGAINGNGNTIYIKDQTSAMFTDFSGKISGVNFVVEASTAPVFQKFSGTMSDVSIKSTITECHVEEDFSPFIVTNKGTLTNITADINLIISTDGIKSTTGVSNMLFVGGIVAVNDKGTIDTCQVTANIVAHGTTNIDTYLGGVVGRNIGTIKNANTTDKSSVEGDTLDTAGVVGLNDYNSTVSDSTNYAKVHQSAISDTWTPNVGGISIANYGIIEACNNFGTLSANGDTATSASTPEIHLGGITGTNSGAIKKCKNDATLTATSGSSYIYIGGIVGQGLSSSASIEDCASFGSYSLNSKADTAFTFIGGTAGLNYGYIYSSFSTATLSGEGENLYIGEIVGVNDYGSYSSNNSFLFGTTYYYNNCYIINKDKSNMGIGILLSGNSLIPLEDDGAGFNAFDSLDELKQSEVYWA